MVSSISSGLNPYAFAWPSLSRNVSQSNNSAQTTASSSGTTAALATFSISTDAKTKAASILSSFDTNYSNTDGHTQADFNAHYAEGARAVSASQGLPEGQYDFTNMSSKEAFIVANDMIVNYGATPDQVSALISEAGDAFDGNTRTFSDAKTDFISEMNGELSFAQAHGYTSMAKYLQGTLAYLSTMNSVPNKDG